MPATMDTTADSGGSPPQALLPFIYADLKRMAARCMATERVDHTLQPTALVHEAYIRLAGKGQRTFAGRTHFFAMAVTTVRRILVDHARGHDAIRRGGGKVTRHPLRPEDFEQLTDPAATLTVNELIEELALVNPRMARIVELRFFADLTMSEIALSLGVSKSTVKSDWKFARAFFMQRLSQDVPPPDKV